MLVPIPAQISYPPPRIPPPTPTKWYETHRFWNGIVLGITFAAWGFGMTQRVMLAHMFFAAAWLCGSSLSLWMACKSLFPRRWILAWVLLSILLGIAIAAMDFYSVHGIAL